MENGTTASAYLGLLPFLFLSPTPSHIFRGMVEKVMAKIMAWPVGVFVNKPWVASPSSLQECLG
jgi:hypothetical protein